MIIVDFIGMTAMCLLPISLVTLIVRKVKKQSCKAYLILFLVIFAVFAVCLLISGIASYDPNAPVPVKEQVEQVEEETPVQEVEVEPVEEQVTETQEQTQQVSEDEPANVTDDNAEVGEVDDTSPAAPAKEEVDPILQSCGITEYEAFFDNENGKMRIVQARIYDSKDMQLNITYEDGVIIYVELTGIMEDFDTWSNRTDKLDLGVGLQCKDAVVLYSDTEGGVLAVLDWENKTLTVK